MSVRTATHGDIEIAYETLGPPDGEPLLLVMGIGAQMPDWPPGFCAALVARGFRLLRFDNRDAGLSTRLDAAGVPGQLGMRLWPGRTAPYRVEDMADDAVAVLDAAGIASAHLAGFSQGGMIAQTVALRHPGRSRSLTSISSTADPRIGRAPLRLLLRIAAVTRRAPTDPEAAARAAVQVAGIVGSAAYPPEVERVAEAARIGFGRGGLDLAATRRHTAAIAASGDRRPALAGLGLPSLVVHGAADPMILPAAGAATARAIPGAQYLLLPGMGHDLPRALWPTITDAIRAVADRAPAAR